METNDNNQNLAEELKALKDEIKALRQEFSEAVQDIHLFTLIKSLKDEDYRVRSYAASSLGNFTHDKVFIRSSLVNAIKAEADSSVRGSIAGSIVRLYQKSSKFERSQFWQDVPGELIQILVQKMAGRHEDRSMIEKLTGKSPISVHVTFKDAYLVAEDLVEVLTEIGDENTIRQIEAVIQDSERYDLDGRVIELLNSSIGSIKMRLQHDY